jgi:hypothetical protein
MECSRLQGRLVQLLRLLFTIHCIPEDTLKPWARLSPISKMVSRTKTPFKGKTIVALLESRCLHPITLGQHSMLHTERPQPHPSDP